jgi:hypothetical protein
MASFTKVVSRPLSAVLVLLATAGACSSDGGGTSDPRGGAGGATACPDGFERCPCYGNHTCQSGLTCASNHCVSLGGSGSGSGGGAPAGPGSGGATGSGSGGVIGSGSGGAATPGEGTGGAGPGTGGAPIGDGGTGGGTGGSTGTTCQPDCLVRLLGGCAPSGACVYSAGRICYANGVKYVSSTNGSVAMTTVTKNGAACATVQIAATTTYPYVYTYRSPTGAVLGTLALYADQTQVVMCPGEPAVTIPASCSSSTTCTAGTCN